ncbi:MAG: hypothetical protein WBD36_10665 [Bacteroidota bacterium]
MNRLREIPLYMLILLVPATAWGQVYGTANHTVTVTVATLSYLQVNLGTVNLDISGANAVAGQNSMSVTDQTSSLSWGTNSSLQKITASTSLAAPLFSLKLLAVTPTTGVAAPEVTLTTTAADLVLNVGRSKGSCTLKYTGIALASQGTGSDAHTVTFTVLAQ